MAQGRGCCEPRRLLDALRVESAKRLWYRKELGNVRATTSWRSFTFLVTLAFFLAALFSAGAAAATGTVFGGPTAPPWIASDEPDYSPGATVTLRGGNWQPGESVHVFVNDDEGRTWSFSDDVIADAGGAISDAFDLPDWFVATYSVTATGADAGGSGTATTSFTDSIGGDASNSGDRPATACRAVRH